MSLTLTRREAVRTTGLAAIALALTGRAHGQPAAQPAPQPAPSRIDGVRAQLRDPSGPFSLLVRFQLKPEALEQFRALLDAAIAGTATEPGVVQYEFHQSGATPTEVVLIEQWRSIEDLALHFDAPHTAAFGASMRTLTAGPSELKVLQPIGPRAVHPAPRGAGFYRFRIGDLQATAVSDGHAVFEPVHPTFGGNLPKDEIDAALRAAFLPTDRFTAECTTLLVRLGRELVLIDTGAGDMFGPTLGKLGFNLAAAGLSPSDITAVVLTHAHPDHIGGLFDHAGRPMFPNARLLLTRAEHDFWMNDPDLSASPLPADMLRGWVEGVQARIRAYGTRVQPVAPGDRAIDGIQLVPSPGHTPGHASVLVSSGSDSLLVTGDTVLHHILGIEKVNAGVVFDMDPGAALASRRAMLDRAAADKSRLLVYHAAWPGLGRVRPKADAFEWVFEPIQW